MFERFTEGARQVIVLAQSEARELKHNYIGTEHILLGLLRQDEGAAARVLGELDVTLEEVRLEVARIVGHGHQLTIGQIPFTPRAKKVLELSLREAVRLGDGDIGPQHILLGLVRDNGGIASSILFDAFGVDAEIVARATLHGRTATVPAFHSGPPRPPSDDSVESAQVRFELPHPLVQALAAPALWITVAAVGLGILIGWLIWG